MQYTEEQITQGKLVVAGKNVKVIAGAGCGKAQPLDEPVLTPTGWKTIGSLVIGEYVFSEKGLPIQVVNAIDHTDLLMYRVTFSDGSSTRCCEDHLWEVQTPAMRENTGASAGKSKVIPLKDMLPKIIRDASKTKKSNYHYSVLLTQPVHFPAKEYGMSPYAMGYTLGNGSSNGNYLRIASWDADVEEVQSYFQANELLSQYAPTTSNVTYFNLTLRCRKYYEIELLSLKSGQKYIPTNYLKGSVDQRKELLAGLLDSDGTCQKNKVSFATTSLMLANNLIELVQSLGGIAKLTKPDTRKDSTCYRVLVRTPFNPFKLKRKASAYIVRDIDVNATKRITGVEVLGYMAGRCITVDSHRQLYLTANYTVTHNSSTLRMVAKQVPARNVLVLTFNKANAEDTLNHPDRPDNLFACTVHSLAYRAIMNPFFRQKLSNWLDYNDLNTAELQQVVYTLGLPSGKEERSALVLFRRTILDCVRHFCQIDQMDIGLVASSYLSYKLITNPDTKLIVPLSAVTRLKDITVQYWINLLENPVTKINPDIYLKLFHLQGHSIKEVWCTTLKRYVTIQVLALDEGQDTNPVTEAIFRNQNHLQRILVGDPNQQLYRWRGAGDTMNNFEDFSIGYLSESFRFNSEIARMANIVLERNESPLRLIGSGKQEEIVTKAYLCRTNATVLETFFDLVTSEGFNGKVTISTDIKGSFAKMYHLESCWFNKRPKYPVPELSAITDQVTMIEALEHSDELKRLNDLSMKIKTATGGLYAAQQMLNQFIAGEGEFSQLTISTIHGSKGLEWDSVTLSDDFLVMDESLDTVDSVELMWKDVDRRCMLYVAVTRSKVECILPWYLREAFAVSA